MVAGVKNIFNHTLLDSKVNPAVVYAAKSVELKKFIKLGSSYNRSLYLWNKKFEKVDKIVGPGNAFVACAKKEVFGDVGIDMIGGPSEVSVVADKSADPDLVAADLIAQAEHDIYAQSILVTDDKKLIDLVNKSTKQLKDLPKRI